MLRRSHAFSVSFHDVENSIPAEDEEADDSGEESVKKMNKNAVLGPDLAVEEETKQNDAVELADMAYVFQENEMLRNVGAYLVPIRRPPSHREVEQDVEKSIVATDNRRPSYCYTSHLDRLAWKQTPSFTDSRSHWDRIRLQQTTRPPSFTDSQFQVKDHFRKRSLIQAHLVWKDSRGRWIWGTCAQPPTRQEIDQWISQNLLTVDEPSDGEQEMEDVELPTIAEEQDYGKRPDSPDYDESSNFFFTPRSLKALTTARKRAPHQRGPGSLYKRLV